jgi:hypothetical protein
MRICVPIILFAAVCILSAGCQQEAMTREAEYESLYGSPRNISENLLGPSNISGTDNLRWEGW